MWFSSITEPATCSEDPVALPMVSFTESIIDLSSANPRTRGTDRRVRVISAVRIMATVGDVESDALLAGVGTIPEVLKCCVRRTGVAWKQRGQGSRAHDLAVLHASAKGNEMANLKGCCMPAPLSRTAAFTRQMVPSP